MTEKLPAIVVPEVPDRADRQFIYDRLVECEEAAAGPLDLKPLAILLKDDEGKTIGGLWGTSVLRWLVIELFFIPDQMRHSGVGTAVMERAEAIARERGCIGLWLDTYTFQAPQFYLRLGFEEYGRVDDHPPGQARVFMRKRFP